MKQTRREFIKIIGCSSLALGVIASFSSIAFAKIKPESDKNLLKQEPSLEPKKTDYSKYDSLKANLGWKERFIYELAMLDNTSRGYWGSIGRLERCSIDSLLLIQKFIKDFPEVEYRYPLVAKPEPIPKIDPKLLKADPIWKKQFISEFLDLLRTAKAYDNKYYRYGSLKVSIRLIQDKAKSYDPNDWRPYSKSLNGWKDEACSSPNTV